MIGLWPGESLWYIQAFGSHPKPRVASSLEYLSHQKPRPPQECTCVQHTWGYMVLSMFLLKKKEQTYLHLGESNRGFGLKKRVNEELSVCRGESKGKEEIVGELNHSVVALREIPWNGKQQIVRVVYIAHNKSLIVRNLSQVTCSGWGDMFQGQPTQEVILLFRTRGNCMWDGSANK